MINATKQRMATVFILSAWAFGTSAQAQPEEDAARAETPLQSKSEEETIAHCARRLMRTRAPIDSDLPSRNRRQSGGRRSNPGGLEKSYERAFQSIAILSRLDKRKVGEALQNAFAKAEIRYFLILAMGRVGGEPNLTTLQKIATIWSEEPTQDPEDVEAQAAAALLYRHGILKPFESVLEAYDRAAGEEMFLEEDESLHFYVRGKLNALAGRKADALADLKKVRAFRVAEGTPKHAASQDPDLYDLRDDPEFAAIAETWKPVPKMAAGGPRPGSGYLGLRPVAIAKEEREGYGMKANEKGVLVVEVTSGTPAEKAGVREGDIVLAIDGEPAQNPEDLTARICSHKAGVEIVLSVLRDLERLQIKVILGKRPARVKNGSSPTACSPGRRDGDLAGDGPSCI